MKDWATWVKNAKFENDEQRAAAVNAAVGARDPRADPNGISYLKMQSALRMVILKVMYENGIDVFVNPEQTTAPYKLGIRRRAGSGRSATRSAAARRSRRCAACRRWTSRPAYTTIGYDSRYVLTADKTTTSR